MGLVAWAQPAAKHGGAAVKATVSARVQLLPSVWIDWDKGALEAAGSSAADLFAPSADVARVKAERLARLRAEERLRKALALLAHDEKQRAHLAPFGGAEQVGKLDVERARVLSVDHASSGSVSLRLSLPLTAPPPADLGSAPDGGGQDLGSGKGSGE